MATRAREASRRSVAGDRELCQETGWTKAGARAEHCSMMSRRATPRAHARRARGDGDTTGSGREATILVNGDETGGRFALVEMVEARGAGLPCHRHHWEDEVLYVLEGELAVCIAGEWVAAPAGTAVFLPRGVEHAVAVVTAQARVLVALAPAGSEGFHRALGELSAGGAALERLVAVAARYGCEITGPAPVAGGDSTAGAGAGARPAVGGRGEAGAAPGRPGRMDTSLRAGNGASRCKHIAGGQR